MENNNISASGLLNLMLLIAVVFLWGFIVMYFVVVYKFSRTEYSSGSDPRVSIKWELSITRRPDPYMKTQHHCCRKDT
ncbi:unnamed protein product [Penicillium camemberti]|uniref:Str. FM013 n=1 Tax=Penicillium camemberti (strain FM 013) TaxID=1429867 RepID=A0A0G4PVP2_PENC3|nr:unnamed protein product [Penicillium camemberti]